jgi:cytochrome c556
MNPIRWALTTLAVLLLGSGHAQDKKPEPKKPTVMQRKLAHAQKVLEGLALNDFDKIRTNADDLNQCAQEAGWKVVRMARYELYSNDFVRHLEGLKKAAKAKNLDGAALAYVEVTLACVKCHQYVREEKIGFAPPLDPLGPPTRATE